MAKRRAVQPSRKSVKAARKKTMRASTCRPPRISRTMTGVRTIRASVSRFGTLRNLPKYDDLVVQDRLHVERRPALRDGGRGRAARDEELRVPGLHVGGQLHL